jgi:iron(II)-dependent oxidoreductase
MNRKLSTPIFIMQKKCAALSAAVGIAIMAVLGTKMLYAQDSQFRSSTGQIPVPACLTMAEGAYGCSDEIHAEWLKDISHWRTERLIRVGYNGARYSMPALTWTQSSFMQPQLMVQDRYFYDPLARKYTVDRYVDDLEERYGGIDSVLIWPSYPNLGIDGRNHLDMIRSMPGGVAGVRQMIADFHRRGVRVLFPMMMWDQGTSDPGRPWPEAIAALMKEIGADGVNGDAQDGVPLAFVQAAENTGHPLAFEPEGGPHDEGLAWNVMTWGFYKFPFAPEVDRFKWLETRHMVNISDRWNQSKTDDLQFAFFNGIGWESWENIWGIWNGITPRDGEAIRRVGSIERSVAPFLVSKDWEPLYPTQRYGVFASRWPLGDRTVWTIVNRNEYDVSGPQMCVAAGNGMRYFDLYHGTELTPELEAGTAVLSFAMEARGYGAVLATPGAPDASVTHLLSRMRETTGAPLASYSDEWKALRQTLVEIPATSPAAAAPEGMVKIPGGDYLFKVTGIEIEGHNDVGVDVQYPWEDSARRFHQHRVPIKPFYMDKFPVTNVEFKRFLDTTHYHPQDGSNFLHDWKNNTYPDGWASKPVTYVSLEDARAYAAWAQKRLPHEWEWQLASQGIDGRLFPWGSTWQPEVVPAPDRSRTPSGPDAVDAHPGGAGPFGTQDLVGNVWQWTDEYVDGHTRAAVLRGGSYYQPQGSHYYFPQAYRNDQHGKLLLFAPSYDRSATVGFRRVKDSE